MRSLAFVFAVIYFVFNSNQVECRAKSDALRGVFVSVFTPMDETGRVNLTNIPAYAQYLKDTGIDGILLSGLGGEGPNLSVDEKKSLYDAWTMFAKTHDLQVITQVGGVALQDTLELARYSNELNVDAILVLPSQYYLPTTAEQLTGFLEIVSNEAPETPIIFYHQTDTLTDVDLSEFFTLASRRITNFQGLFTDLKTALEVEMTNKLRSDQRIYIFDYVLTSAAILYGYDSFIEYVPNICPELYLDIINYTEEGNLEQAADAQWQLTNLIHDLTTGFDTISALKVATELVSGIQLGNTRLPFPPITEDEIEDIAEILEKYDISLAK